MGKNLWKVYFKYFFITLLSLSAIVAIIFGIFFYTIGGLNRTKIDEENLSVNTDVSRYGDGKIMNIAFFGIDSQSEDNKGRSDSIMIASVNGRTGKIKLISIARDTYVEIPGHGKTKLNHAYAYGGAELAIQTLNETFGLDIKDYVTVNFDSLAEIIDEMGGVTIDVTDEEVYQINKYLLSGENLYESGLVNLTGPQAVSYARIRKIGGDLMRGQRQRTVLNCLFEKAKEINPLLYPSYVRKFSPMVETSLNNEEILQITSVGVSGNLSLEQGALPNENLPSGGERIDGVWYFVYDTELASDMLVNFIYYDIPFNEYGKDKTEETLETEDNTNE